MMGVNWVIFSFLLSLAPPYATGQAVTEPPPPLPVYALEPKIKVSPPLAIILACLVSAFFVMGCISVYVRQCFERRLARSFALADDDHGVGGRHLFRRATARGLDPSLIDSFPTFVYSEVKGLKIGKAALECAVCLNEFEDDETLRLLPKCSHVFHPDCIDAWLASHITCPVCRANLVPKPGEKIDLFSIHVPIHDSDSDLVDSDREIHDFRDQHLGRVANDLPNDVQSSPDVINQIQTPNQSHPHGSTPRKTKTTGKFPRSHSTGHSLIQPGENCERFTLRLPEEVKNRLLNTSLSRAKSCTSFPRARSSRKGFRSSSGGTGRGRESYYERFDGEIRSDRWVFSMAPPFISRSGSARSQSVVGDEVTATPNNLFKSIKSPLDRFLGGTDKDNIGERSFNRLRLDDKV